MDVTLDAAATVSKVDLKKSFLTIGTIVLDKDFGAGYSYPVLLEDASITTE